MAEETSRKEPTLDNTTTNTMNIDEDDHYLFPQLDGLSNDNLSWLLSYLSIPDITSVSLVSRRCHVVCRSNTLWKLKFEDRWNIDTVFRLTVSGQNWYRAYQAAYKNPHDLWLFHWNCTFPQDGLVPGRCCIYDNTSNTIVESSEQQQQQKQEEEEDEEDDSHDLCPPCRFFPNHPLKVVQKSLAQKKHQTRQSQKEEEEEEPTLLTEVIAEATDHSLRDFAKTIPKDLPNSENKDKKQQHQDYTPQRAQSAFSHAATFHRTLNTQQYTAAPPRQPSSSSSPACLTPLTDLLFFNVSEEPLSTHFGQQELYHLYQERSLQQDWEQSTRHHHHHQRQNNNNNNHTHEFAKPAHETAHHTWHQVVVTNPDFVRPVVFRISVARPDCFVVFPSEGFLPAGQSAVVTFGVRPLGSLIATAFETINAQRYADPGWMQDLYDEEGPLPCAPFCVRYKYSSVIPCIPARGFVSPHQPQPRHDDDQDDIEPLLGAANTTNHPSVADVCWEQKQMIDYHWSGGESNNNNNSNNNSVVEPHEVRSFCLSAHVNAHYPFAQFLHETLTPFDLTVDPSPSIKRRQQQPSSSLEQHQSSLPMLFFAAPQLYEFYPQSVYPQLQQVQLETEVSHAGHVFRSHRRKCQKCRRNTWGPRLEEMGQAFVLARLDAWKSNQKQEMLLRNCAIIVQTLQEEYQRQEHELSNSASLQQQQQQLSSFDDADRIKVAEKIVAVVVRRQQLLYVVQKMILRYRAATFVVNKLKMRSVLTRLEMLADCLYGINGQEIDVIPYQRIPWRECGTFRYATSSGSVFRPQQALTMDHPEWSLLAKDDDEDMDSFRYLIHTPGKFHLGPQEDPNHLGELVPSESSPYHQRQKGCATDMFMDDPLRGLQSALITIQDPRSVLVHGIYDRVPYPGKVVRRPQLPHIFMNNKYNSNSESDCPAIVRSLLDKAVFYRLQDALGLTHLLPQMSDHSVYRTLSMRRYLRNIPPLGMGRFPLSIDDGSDPTEPMDEKPETPAEKDGKEVIEVSPASLAEETTTSDNRLESSLASLRPFASSRIVALSLPDPVGGSKSVEGAVSPSNSMLSESVRNSGAHRGNARAHVNNAAANDNNNNFGGNMVVGVGAPLFRGPGPRLLNLIWSISAQLGWAVDDGSQIATAVVVNRHLLIGMRWLSLALMAFPLFWTLCARAAHWIPCKPVDYHLEDLPYQLTSEMRFLSELECGGAAVVLFLILLYLGRWCERWTSRDFTRAMLEHISFQTLQSTFLERLLLRYKRRWDEVCPLFLQRLTFIPQWNLRSAGDLFKHICFWRSQDFREHRSVFRAVAGRGLMFWGGRWDDIEIEDHSSRKLLLAAIGALGSFSSTTPHFWMNLLTVFSCSISLGLSMSLHSLEKGVSGGAYGSVGAVLKGLNLVTLVSLSFLLGQLLGSSGGVLFLAEFVVTSISFILGGAGTISASSVESWGCFFCLSSTAFWGYLFGRVALMDGVIRQKRLVRSSLFSTTLLCASLALVAVLWIVVSLWRWNLPQSLMILRPSSASMAKTARGATGASAASGGVARRAAADYAAKHLQ
ncbi:expressed unknown protein [Seminavis robusta]|uniref:F-box domain-containing protein n=1 Tax=Seminavis robusta TaxID=568900 RepID=A0A9N8HF99_9STRA|nr:expressed unknown protein [Seminavis robusta]|eukprot:Sro445_g144610.1 n/a (1556) ;mRNA; r:58014-62934